jgi:hypothetical protein
VRLRVAALTIWFNILRDLSTGLLPDLGKKMSEVAEEVCIDRKLLSEILLFQEL